MKKKLFTIIFGLMLFASIGIVSAATPLNVDYTLFSDTFQDGILNDQWIINGGAEIALVSGENSALVFGTTETDYDRITSINIDTTKYKNIEFLYDRMLQNVDDGATFRARYSINGGTSWTDLEDDVEGDDADFVPKSFTLPETANDNPNLVIRFALKSGDTPSENVAIDNVYIIGDEIDEESPEVTLEILDPEYPTCSDEITVCATIEDESDLGPVSISCTQGTVSAGNSNVILGDIVDGQYCETFSPSSMAGYPEVDRDGKEVVCTVNVADEFGNEADEEEISFKYDCLDPVADATNGEDYSCNEAGSVLLDASLSTDSASGIKSYLWDFDNDGDYDDATGVTTTYNCVDGDATPTIGLKVVDYVDRFDTTTTSIEIANVDPVAEIESATCDEGEVITLDASASSDVAGLYDPLTFAWNLDGTGYVSGISTISYTCVDGDTTPEVCVQVEDGDGGVDNKCIDVVISNVAPTAIAGGPYYCNEGESVTLSGGVTDPGILDTHTYMWTIDGNDYSGQTITYDCLDGDAPITAYLKVEDESDFGLDQATINVANVDPWSLDFAIDETPEVVDVQVCFDGSATDVVADMNAGLTFTWDFGDEGSSSDEHVCHTYHDRGTYDVTMTVTDKDGGSNSITKQVLVYDYKIVLTEGWNLISIPLVPEVTTVEHVFDSVKENVAKIWSYTYDSNLDKNVWEHTEYVDGAWTNPEFKIVPGYGYYVLMEKQPEISVVSEEPTMDYYELFLNGEESYAIGEPETDSVQENVMGLPPSVTLAMNSWNLIGVYGLEVLDKHYALKSLTDQDNEHYFDILYNDEGEKTSYLDSKDGYWLSMKLIGNLKSIEYKANYDNDCDGPWCYGFP